MAELLSVQRQLDELEAERERLSDQRLNLMKVLADDGVPKSTLAAHLGLSRPRVTQILEPDDMMASRTLIGTGKSLIVAAGAKPEGNRPDTIDGEVVSTHVMRAQATLRDLADRLKFTEVTQEVVPPGGFLNLNRTSLVVLTSPRLLREVGSIIEGDPHLGFGNDRKGWHLIDRATGTVYRSPMDRGEPVDYAYLGRLPRPDRKGSFLHMGGIHAPGTAGAAQHLADNLPQIRRQVGSRRHWSMLIEVRFDPDTRDITSTAALTTIQPGSNR